MRNSFPLSKSQARVEETQEEMMKNFVNFLSSGVGLLVLGFLLTTGGGTLLNHFIQKSTFENERSFQMYKMRLEEAKSLQKALLESSTARVFYLEQILARLGNPNQKPEDTKKFWHERYSDVKDNWNKNLVYWQAQMRVLFPGHLYRLLVNDMGEGEFYFAHLAVYKMN
jgi:hypothetical protein